MANSKIRQLPGTRTTPATVLARTLEKSDEIESVIVCIQWKDGSNSTDWSQMKLREAIFGLHSAELGFNDEMRAVRDIIAECEEEKRDD